MNTAIAPHLKPLMTAEEFLAIPEDGIARELIRGEIREYGMTLRNHMHGEVVANVVHVLKSWNGGQPRPRGLVSGGDTGFRLSRDPDVVVGPDVAYASAELIARTPRTPTFYDGPPLLAVEVLSPSDRHEEVVEKVQLYLDAGVVVWVVDPDFRWVSVHRPGFEPEVFNASAELVADPYLPGLRATVAAIFDE